MNNTRQYSKLHARFKCTNTDCQRTWYSANAWIAIDNIFCKTCNCSGTVENIQDKLGMFTVYMCTNHACHSFNMAQRQWCPFPESRRMKCHICQIPIVHKMSTPMFVRQYTVKCTNNDFKLTHAGILSPPLTQRCCSCGFPGYIFATGTMLTHNSSKRQDQQVKVHATKYCEMCQELFRRGIRRSCLGLKAVVCNF